MTAKMEMITEGGLQQTFDMLPVSQQPGLYKGVVVPPEEGPYRFTLVGEEEEASHDVSVRIPRLENEALEMKFELLEKMAKATRPSGQGAAARAYRADQVRSIPDEIRAAQIQLAALAAWLGVPTPFGEPCRKLSDWAALAT